MLAFLCCWRPSRPSNPQPRERTILVLGSLGVGKSSLVNMLVGKNVAPVGNGIRVAHPPIMEYSLPFSDILADTLPSQSDLTLKIYDTVGLEHRPSPWRAIKARLKRSRSADLVLYCMRRGRLTNEQVTHLRDIWNTFCQDGVPLVLVICNTDYRRGSTEKWWGENGEELTKAVQVRFADHVFLNTFDPAHPSWERHGIRYEEAQRLIRDAVIRNCRDVHFASSGL